MHNGFKLILLLGSVAVFCACASRAKEQDAVVFVVFKFSGTPQGGELTVKCASDPTKFVKIQTANGDSIAALHKNLASGISGKLGTLSAVAIKDGVFIQNANTKSFRFETTDEGIQLPPSPLRK